MPSFFKGSNKVTTLDNREQILSLINSAISTHINTNTPISSIQSYLVERRTGVTHTGAEINNGLMAFNALHADGELQAFMIVINHRIYPKHSRICVANITTSPTLSSIFRLTKQILFPCRD